MTQEKDIKDMTLREIEDLQSQYKKEFCEVVEQFFEERPMIDRIWLFENTIFGNYSATLQADTLRKVVRTIHLKGV